MSRRTTVPARPAGSGPLFGAELRHQREARELTQVGLAQLIPCDRSLIAHVEAGTRVPQEPLVATCDKVLDTGGLLMRLWSRINWYADVEHPDWFRRYAQLEAEATRIRAFQVSRAFGLLQTENYARALFARDALAADDALIEERVTARLSRQRRFLADGHAPFLVVVLDESVIRQVVGGRAVMREQCAHLLAVGKRPNIRIQVAPFELDHLAPPDTSMSLLTALDGQEWVYSESLDRGHFSDDPDVIARHARTYDVLRADALSAPESAALITSAMEGYEDHEGPRSERGGLAKEQPQRGKRGRMRRGGPRSYRRRPGA